MNRHKIVRLFTILIIVMVNIGCDQVSKSMVRNNLYQQENISVIQDHLTLTNVENSGAFLSFGDELPPLAKIILLSLLPALSLLVLLFWLFRQQGLSQSVVFGLSCVIGGGIGNIFDRIIHGSVTDFLYIEFGIFSTGIFNLADISITGGMLFLLLLRLFQARKE